MWNGTLVKRHPGGALNTHTHACGGLPHWEAVFMLRRLVWSSTVAAVKEAAAASRDKITKRTGRGYDSRYGQRAEQGAAALDRGAAAPGGRRFDGGEHPHRRPYAQPGGPHSGAGGP